MGRDGESYYRGEIDEKEGKEEEGERKRDVGDKKGRDQLESGEEEESRDKDIFIILYIYILKWRPLNGEASVCRMGY